MGDSMIYSVYIASFMGAYANERPQNVAALIKAAPEDASFIFIPTIRQIEEFKNWLTKWKLNNLIQYASPEPFINGSHPTEGPRLYIYVLSKSEIKESGYVTATNIRGQA